MCWHMSKCRESNWLEDIESDQYHYSSRWEQFFLGQTALIIWYVLVEHYDCGISYRIKPKQFPARPLGLAGKTEKIRFLDFFDGSAVEHRRSIPIRKIWWKAQMIRDAKNRRNFWIETNSLHRPNRKIHRSSFPRWILKTTFYIIKRSRFDLGRT